MANVTIVGGHGKIALLLAPLLVARGDTVTSVCFDVGCSSLGSFSALFHRRVGLAPSTYRAQTRRLVQVPGGLRRALSPGCFELMAQAWEVQFRRSNLRPGVAPDAHDEDQARKHSRR